ncbi:DEAD/DEAH box helicase [Clostridium ljungdahlii]|uniref:DEAD-box ATP-dependent RNA helicase CshA n=1 Tax=Clostridium ljungdahlii (strain ATCC 55383 / DSM 13528 / PETC) TaxID=748727 RepID=D8GKL7_CLOLD|nr:DEAD/DEAH box helicase [Clostridium ljungdahlii]ADK15357.1 predicted ATP-dependent RNA helicase [Clostridium ljungdahlii DSM 13528]OAA88457.1 DEAD-box ATP-dependent RNA helicase CshA [Clostridium ljungdahlii DSM 13528]
MDFKELELSENIINELKHMGITKPTPIQQESIKFIREGKDVIAEAQTGTGKTLAFLLPIFENISPNINSTQALIVTPTRELAIQITEEALKLKKAKDINILAAYGGKDIGSQLKKLKRNIHLIIATPGRLLDHLHRKTIDLSKLKTLVLDEADQMLLMGFKNDVEDIIKEVSKKRQTLCFSATMNSDVKKLAYRYMTDPLVVSIKKEKVTLNNIKQYVIETTDRKKQDALCNIIDQDNPFMAIIFCRTKRRVDDLEIALYQRGYNCKKLHSDIPQSKRERIMKSFRNADIQYLIATDVAARGLDISGVTHIYNYDIPENVESYIHRIGRTGRAGEEGCTCLFVDPKDKRTLEEIERGIKFRIPRRELNI